MSPRSHGEEAKTQNHPCKQHPHIKYTVELTFQRFMFLDAKLSHIQVSCAVFKLPGPLPKHSLNCAPRIRSSYTNTLVRATVAKVF